MHPFQRHGISHLSCSALNLWRSSPGIWALKYLAKIKDDGSAAMWRGNAVENGMAHLLRGASLKDALNGAHQSFELNARGELSDELDAERELISPMLEQCLRWQAPSTLNATQLKIEHWFADIPVPVIGYLDFAFNGIDVDLKTTKACPSTPRPDHVRQVSLYRAARGRNGGLLYVTGKRHAYFGIDDDTMERALGDLENDAQAMFQFLTAMPSTKDALRCLPIDRDHYAYPKITIPLDQILLAG